MKIRIAFIFIAAYSIPAFAVIEINSFSPGLFGSKPIISLKSTSLSSVSTSNVVDVFEMDTEAGFFAETNSITNTVSPIAIGTDSSTPVVTQIIGSAYNYPNPFKFSTGSSIGYMLSTDATIELKVFNLIGQTVCAKTLISGIDEGAKSGYNRIPVNKSLFGTDLSGGLYIYLLIYQGKVLAKGKMAVLP